MPDFRDPDFYLAHASYVRALARRLVYDADAADDVAQAAWLAALQRPPRDGSSPERWFSRVVRNLACKALRSAIRRRERERHWEPPNPTSSPADVLSHEQERQRVVAALLDLEEPYRRVLIAHFFDGLSPSAIAARDGVPVETVRTQQKRGLHRLRARLVPDGAAALALANGLQLGAPPTAHALAHLVQGVLLVQVSKSSIVAAACLVLAVFGWWVAASPASVETTGSVAGVEAAASDAMPRAPEPVVDARALASAEAVQRTAAPVSELAEASGSLLVRVRRSDGSEAAGASVRATAARAANPGASARTEPTDARGSARFASLRSGAYWVECDRGAVQQCQVHAGQCTEVDLVQERGARVRGRVFDLDGTPAVGASIHLSSSSFDWQSHAVAESDRDGAFVLQDVPVERRLALSARMPMRAPTPQVALGLRAESDLEVELRFVQRGGAIAGRVVDEHGQPVAGAFVMVGSDRAMTIFKAETGGAVSPLQGFASRSDADGQFLVVGVAAGQTEVHVLADGFAPWNAPVFVPVDVVANCLAALQPGARLVGTVRDESGRAVTDAEVAVGNFGLRTWRTRTGSDGAFSIDGLPIGPFDAMARADGLGRAATDVVGRAGAAETWHAVLTRARTLRGRVVRGDQPIAAAEVAARCMPSSGMQWFANATSSAEGAFELTNCPDALLHLEARTHSSGQFVVAVLDDVDPNLGAVVLEVDRAREPTAVATGRVVDADGKPLPGVEVLLLPQDVSYGGGHSLQTDAEGRFRSPPCPPGAWYLSIRAEGMARRSAPVRALTVGAETDWGDLPIARSRQLFVRVLASEGLDLDGLVVGLADDVLGFGSSSPENGVARFGDIAPGEYVLTAYAPGVALRPSRIRVSDDGQTHVDLQLHAGSAVVVDVVDERGAPARDRLEVELRDGDGVLVTRSVILPGDGATSFSLRLVAGRYRFRFADHRKRTAEVQLVVPDDGQPVRATARF